MQTGSHTRWQVITLICSYYMRHSLFQSMRDKGVTKLKGQFEKVGIKRREYNEDHFATLLDWKWRHLFGWIWKIHQVSINLLTGTVKLYAAFMYCFDLTRFNTEVLLYWVSIITFLTTKKQLVDRQLLNILMKWKNIWKDWATGQWNNCLNFKHSQSHHISRWHE